MSNLEHGFETDTDLTDLDDADDVDRTQNDAEDSGRSDEGDENEKSITLRDTSRRREDMRLVPALFVMGDADHVAPPADQRLILFDDVLHIGRRAPGGTGDGVAWVVADRLVSGQHCVISREGDREGWKLTDLGSRNGTAVDGLMAHEPVHLRDGAIIFVGTHIAVFHTVAELELEAIRSELKDPFGPVPTASPTGAVINQLLRKLAPSQCELLLTGETGVGKEVYATAIHANSSRNGRFVPINCAALPRELVESELFGYVRGAHSQAREAKRGLFEEADGGTLFLDEVGDMSPELQTKLLRFLQDREITPLGATRPRRLDLRVLAATSRTTAPTAAAPGVGLRADLAARLGAEPIRLPPLRHRIEDLGALAAYFMKLRACRFEPVAFQALALYAWPGNVRELEKVMLNADLLSRDSEVVTLEHLPAAIASGPGRVKAAPPGAAMRPPPPSPRQLEQLLAQHHGNIQRIARELGRTPPLIYRWCKRFKLDPDRYRVRT